MLRFALDIDRTQIRYLASIVVISGAKVSVVMSTTISKAMLLRITTMSNLSAPCAMPVVIV